MEGDPVTRLVVLNVSGEALREALSSFGANNLALWSGWVPVRIAGLFMGYGMVLVTAWADLFSMTYWKAVLGRERASK